MDRINKFLIYSLSFLTIGFTSSCTTFNKGVNFKNTDPSVNVITGVQDIISDYMKVAQIDHSLIKPNNSEIRKVRSKIFQYQAISGVSDEENLDKSLDQMVANLYAMDFNFENGKVEHNFDRALEIYMKNPDFNSELKKDLEVINIFLNSIMDPESGVGLSDKEAKINLVERIFSYERRKQNNSDEKIDYPENNLGFVDESKAVFLESQRLSIEYAMFRYGDYVQGIMLADEVMREASDSYIVSELGFLKAKGYESLEDSLKYKSEETINSIKKTGFDTFLREKLGKIRDITEEEDILDNSTNIDTLAGIYSGMCNSLKTFALINVKNNYIGSPAAEFASMKLKMILANENYEYQIEKK
jgi:hypothetical protein